MSSVTGFDRDDVKVKGLDAGGNEVILQVSPNGALLVEGDSDAQRELVHGEADLKNGSSADMTVNGAVTSVDFTAGPPAGQVWYVYDIGLTIRDSGANDPDRFGAISGGLTNGVLLTQKIDSTEYDYKAFKTNLEVVNCFTMSSHFVGVGSGFVNDPNLFTGNIGIAPSIRLIGDNGDKIIARVRDDLTSLNNLLMRINYWRGL